MTKRKQPPVAMTGVVNTGGQHGGPQMIRDNGKRLRFDAAARRRFLDAFALCCNVRMAAEHTGIHWSTVNKARRGDPIFAARWREALDTGMERLEAQILEQGGAGMPLESADSGRAPDDAYVPPPFDFDKAIRALGYHAKARAGIQRRSRVRPTSAADTDAAIEKLLVGLRKRAAAERPALAPVPELPAPAEGTDT